MGEEDWELDEQHLEFSLGERVRMWSKGAGAWKVGTVRGLVWTPHQRSEDPEYREVIFDGTEERVTCRVSDLRCVPPIDSAPPVTDDEHIFEPGDRVRVRDVQSVAWKVGTVRQVIARRGEEAAPGEYLLIVSYRVAFDDGGSGRFGPAEMERLGGCSSTPKKPS